VNDVSANPWVLDTPGPALLWPAQVKVEHFEFVNYAAQGNQAIIQGFDGKIKWSVTGAADLEEVRSAKVGWINGLVMPTLQGGGKILVYIAP